jgi:hypothetical protein
MSTPVTFYASNPLLATLPTAKTTNLPFKNTIQSPQSESSNNHVPLEIQTARNQVLKRFKMVPDMIQSALYQVSAIKIQTTSFNNEFSNRTLTLNTKNGFSSQNNSVKNTLTENSQTFLNPMKPVSLSHLATTEVNTPARPTEAPSLIQTEVKNKVPSLGTQITTGQIQMKEKHPSSLSTELETRALSQGGNKNLLLNAAVNISTPLSTRLQSAHQKMDAVQRHVVTAEVLLNRVNNQRTATGNIHPPQPGPITPFSHPVSQIQKNRRETIITNRAIAIHDSVINQTVTQTTQLKNRSMQLIQTLGTGFFTGQNITNITNLKPTPSQTLPPVSATSTVQNLSQVNSQTEFPNLFLSSPVQATSANLIPQAPKTPYQVLESRIPLRAGMTLNLLNLTL